MGDCRWRLVLADGAHFAQPSLCRGDPRAGVMPADTRAALVGWGAAEFFRRPGWRQANRPCFESPSCACDNHVDPWPGSPGAAKLGAARSAVGPSAPAPGGAVPDDVGGFAVFGYGCADLNPT